MERTSKKRCCEKQCREQKEVLKEKDMLGEKDMSEEKSERLTLPKFGYGCWQLGSKGKDDYWGLEYTDELADQLIPLAISNNITYMDTAEGYNNGDSERQLSKSLGKLTKQKTANVIIGTKILPNNAGDVRKTVDGMLERLQVSCLDLIMIHWPSKTLHFIVSRSSNSNNISSSCSLLY